MDQLDPAKVATTATKVAVYGSQLAGVFHSYSLTADKIPPGFEGAINILDATVATLKQLLPLLEAEAGEVEVGTSTRLFSEDGLQYVMLLVKECATTLAKVEPMVSNACLSAKELKAKRRREKKILAKNGPVAVDIGALTLDEKTFLNVIESTKWSLATQEIEECMERLYDLQLHLILVFQVVTVGALYTDASTSKVDIKGIVSFHDRISRTAKLVGIKLPKNRPRNKRFGSDSSSETISLSESSESGSDVSRWLKGGPPPPPPAPAHWRSSRHGPSPTAWPDVPHVPINVPANETTTPSPPIIPQEGTTGSLTNPPSYSEGKSVGDRAGSTASTKLGSMSQTSNVPTVEVLPETPTPIQGPIYPDEKEKSEAAPTDNTATKCTVPSKFAPLATLEPRLFNSNTKGLRFRVGNVFRSNQSLAEEMRKTLSDADSRLVAVIITSGTLRQVPHSAFHSLEATHMRTILSQLHGNEWYDTFTKLDANEHMLLDTLLHMWVHDKKHDRDLVVLKVIHKTKYAWAALLKDVLGKSPVTYRGNRVVLAIAREHLVDGKPVPIFGIPLNPRAMLPLGQISTAVPTVRPPVEPPVPRDGYSTKLSDLRSPPLAASPDLPIQAPSLPVPLSNAGPPVGTTVPPTAAPIASIRISDTTPLTDDFAILALTSYNEYTLHQADSAPGMPRSWTRVAITQETPEKHHLIAHVAAFQRAGGNVLEAKLRLTEPQSAQVTRLMDQLKNGERDPRFEWCWAEISLYNCFGEIRDFAQFASAGAVKIHLVAKRMPKPHWRPMEVYNSLMRGPPLRVASPPPVVVNVARSSEGNAKRRRRAKYEIESDSESTIGNSLWSDDSDSSVGNVRRRLRKIKIRKAARDKWGTGSLYADSDEESEEEDVIKIRLVLKRGDDVVQALLDLWTPKMEVKGNGKEKMTTTQAKVFGESTNF